MTVPASGVRHRHRESRGREGGPGVRGHLPVRDGGVSVWCDQLIRGLPDYRWEMVALTVDGTEQAVWEARPRTWTAYVTIPLWALRQRAGPAAPAGPVSSREPYDGFLAGLVTPAGPAAGPGRPCTASRFLAGAARACTSTPPTAATCVRR